MDIIIGGAAGMLFYAWIRMLFYAWIILVLPKYGKVKSEDMEV